MREFLIFTISLFLFAACSGVGSKSNQKEVSLNDGARRSKDGAIIIDDRDLDRNRQPISTTRESTQEMPQTGSDGSQTQAMTDGFGNRIETRVFDNHPLLQRIVLRIFANGQKKVFVYGQNGDVNDLPDEMKDKAMNAPADELAKSAGIFMGRDDGNLPYFLQIIRQKQLEALQTFVPTYQFPTPAILTEPDRTEAETQKNASTAEPILNEPKPLTSAQKQMPERNYQAEMNQISLQPTKRITPKTEGTLTQNAKPEEAEKANK